MTLTYDKVNVGDELPEHVSAAISRHTLALYCGASGDHNPMHVDIDFAKKFGMPDVFAHGMLSMAFLAQLLTKWVPQERVRHWAVRFTSITPVHAKVICTGKVTEKFEENGEKRLRLEISAKTDAGLQTLAGDAVITLP
ncbi:MAG TPA: MaoC family dehydratase [Parvibaculum sp.]|jgi:acyl dehydratase